MAKFIIDIQTRGFSQAKRNLADVTKQSRSYSRESNNAGTATAVMRKEVSQLRNNLLLYTFAIGGVIRALGSFVKSASDAAEEQSKFNIVFGDFGDEALKFADHIQSSFGIAKSEMVSLMAKLQDTFVPLGFSREQASELSIAMSQLALDVGSLQNRMTSEVAARFTSAIVGNHEAVRELGISITEAELKTESMRLGLAGLGKELTKEQKLLSRLSLISRGSADAQGNLTDTQFEFANALRGTQGRLRTLREDIGNMIIPFAKVGLVMVDFMANARRAGILLGGLTSALVLYTASAIKAAYAQWALNRAMTGNVVIAGITALAFAIDLAYGALKDYGKVAEDIADPVKDIDDLIRKFAAGNLDLSNGVNASSEAEEKRAEAIADSKKAIESQVMSLKVKVALMQEETELGKERARAWIAEERSLTFVEVALLKQIDAMNDEVEAQKESVKWAKERQKLLDDQMSKRDALASAYVEMAITLAELNGASELELDTMRLKDDLYQGLSKVIGDQAGEYAMLVDIAKENSDISVLENMVLSDLTVEQQKHIDALIKTYKAKALLLGLSSEATKKAEDEKDDVKNAAERLKAEQTIMQDNFDFQIGLIEEQADRFIELEMDQVAVKEWAEGEKLKLAMDRFEQENELMSVFGGAYNTFINSLTDTAMSGAERHERVMEAIQSSVIKFFADLVVQAIKNEIAMQAVRAASNTGAVVEAVVTGKAIAMAYATPAALANAATAGGAAIAGGIAISSLVASTQAQAMFAAEGADFITSGPQLLVVGDNTGGREHVQVTPIGSPGPNAPSGGNITININAPLLDDTVVDSIIPAIERAKRLNLA